MENIIISRKEYEIACKEVLEILKNVKKEDLDKIPNQEIEKLQQNANNDYQFTYIVYKDIKEQNVSKLAKAIIAHFFIEYIANGEQRQKILRKQQYDLMVLEEEKRKKYQVNDIFQNEEKPKNNNVSDKLPIVRKKENFWYKILKYIIEILKV